MTIFILSGESSGDGYGATLAEAFRKLSPECRLYGIGGDAMAAQDVTLFAHIRDLSILGFTAILPKIFDLVRLKGLLVKEAGVLKPDAIVLIDFPDFNLHVANAIRRKLPITKIFYYIPPQIWIWRMSRIMEIKSLCSAVFPLFDFEHDLYSKTGIASFYFGHPLMDSLNIEPVQNSDTEGKTLGLFPGSRRQEVQSILPVMLATVNLVQHEHPMEIVIGKSTAVPQIVYDKVIAQYPVRVSFHDSKQAILKSDVVLTKSGTINLELSYYEKPFIVVYKTSWINWFVGKYILRIKWISLINILAKKEIVKEFIQYDAKPAALAVELLKIISVSTYRKTMIENLRHLNERIFVKKVGRVCEKIAREIIDSCVSQ